jgi:hypothetical protein
MFRQSALACAARAGDEIRQLQTSIARPASTQIRNELDYGDGAIAGGVSVA